MPETLLLLIGKGQTELKVGGYRTAKYILPDQPERSVETPFVGEALLRLHETGRFSHVHIFGTKDAMWDVLHFHCLQHEESADADEKMAFSFALEEAVKQRSLQPDSPLLREVAAVFSQRLGVTTSCHLIDLGTTPAELWNIFRLMTDPALCLEGATLSIDVTHSLRFHPLFFVFTLMYFQAVRPETRFGSIFYGGLELIRDYDGFAPIFDLKPFLDMMQWIHAAQAFTHYGDPAPAGELLDHAPLLDSMKGFSQMLQLNNMSQITIQANRMVKALRNRSASLPDPLQVVAPRMAEFPQHLRRNSASWSAILAVADYHYQHSRLGLAVLASWEAVIARVAEIYQQVEPVIDNTRYQDYRQLSKIAQQSLDEVYTGKIGFCRRVKRLNRFRNRIAHANGGNPQDIPKEFPEILDFLRRHLGDDCLRHLPIHRSWKQS